MATIGLLQHGRDAAVGPLPVRHRRDVDAPGAVRASPCRPPWSPSALLGLPAQRHRRSATAARGRWAARSSCRSGWSAGFLVPIAHPARLGAADLLAAGAHLGRARRSGRRPWAATRCLTSCSACSSVRATSRSACCCAESVLHSARRNATPGAVMTPSPTRPASSCSAGITSYRALFNWLTPVDPHPDLPGRADLPDPAVRLPGAQRRASSRTSTSSSATRSSTPPSPACSRWATRSATSASRRRSASSCPRPRPRVPLFLGRALPVIVNGWVVALFALVVGGLIFSIDVPASAYLPIAVGQRWSRPSRCTGLGLVGAALSPAGARDGRARQRHLRHPAGLLRRQRAARAACPEWMVVGLARGCR